MTQNSQSDCSSDVNSNPQEILFSSGNRELRTSGHHTRIQVPANGGANGASPFQIAVNAALSEASKNGQQNQIIVGAIPFDTSEPSCLYIPEQFEWVDRSENSAQASLQKSPTLLADKSIPDEAGFKRAVKQAVMNLQHSDVDKAVLSATRELQFAETVDVEQLLASLRAQNKDGYQFRIPLSDGSKLIGVSPELLVRKTGGHITCNPLAGSAKRQADPEQDHAVAEKLLGSEKDQYEHSVVIREMKRVLEPHCAELSVPDSPSLLSTSALWHLSTVIEAELKDPSMTALQVACLLHPTPAICGFPTELAHRLIRFVEPFERGLFTGIVGWSDLQGNGEWVITIRSGIVHNDVIRVFAGAGIVEASQPDSEWNEIQTKMSTMLNACGLGA